MPADLWKYAVSSVAAYLLGSLNFGIIVSKIVTKQDIRSQGSGNAGATNSLRVLGPKLAALVSLGDVLKGVLGAFLGGLIVSGGLPLDEFGKLLGGLFATLGHVFPVYFGFKGGKGVFTTCAAMFVIDWRIAAIALGLFIVVVLISRYVSLGSILAACTLPFTSLALGRTDPLYMGTMIVFAVGIVLLHRQNILRLIRGTESRLGRKKEQ